MKHILLRALWLSVLVYACVMGIWGPAGRRASLQAEADKAIMLNNLNALTDLNQTYQQGLAYGQQPEAMALQARTLGYIAPTEVVLRLDKNLKTAEAKMPETGRSVVYVPMATLTDSTAKKIALYAGLIALLGFGAIHLFGLLHKRRS